MVTKAKNPKRVAAGKKAWRNRGKGKKRGGSRGGGGRGYTKKRHVKGLSGRIGAVILGVLPPALAGLEATSATMAAKKQNKLNAIASVQFGVMRWLNNLSSGFFGKAAFSGNNGFAREDGSYVSLEAGYGLQPGSLWSVAGVGMLMMTYDWVASKLAGGSGTKIPMTNFYATGNA